MKTNTILSLFKPVKNLVNKVLGIALDKRFLGYLRTNHDPLPFVLA